MRGKSAVAEARVLVRAPPQAVMEAFRDPSRLRVWYFEDVEVELVRGGRIAFRGIEGDVEAKVLDVREDGFDFAYEPPWWGSVRVDVAPEGKGTRVLVRHDGFEGREEWIDRYAWGWTAHLRNLKAYLEGRTVK